jgi:hypothetical protein
VSLGGSHLGGRVSAVVDDQMPADERERALTHLVVCDLCRAAVDAERRAKATLRSLPAPEPPAALLAGLLELGGPSGPLPRDRATFPGGRGSGTAPGWPSGSRRPGTGFPAGRPGLLRRSGRAPVRVAIAAVGVAGASLGLAFAAGGSTSAPVGPAVVPAFDAMTAEHLRQAPGSPFTDLAAVTALGDAAAGGGAWPVASPLPTDAP